MGLFGDLFSSAPDAPDLPSAPEFKSSFYYDEEGNLSGSISKDAQGNIVYKPKTLTAGEQINKKVIQQTRQTLLQRLYSTPEEYTKAATAESDAWAANQTKAAGDQFTKDTNRIGEVSNQRGLLGSKAYSDIIKNREKTQSETGAAIANSALSMRQDLIDRKRAGDYNLYSLYSGAENEYSQKALQGLQATSGLSNQINSFNSNNYGAEVNAKMAQYEADMASYKANDPWRNYIMPGLQTYALLSRPATKASDRRLKTDIRPEFKVGEVQFYSFEYVSAEDFPGLMPPPGRYVGVMADEVKHLGVVIENALGTKYDMVDYEALRRHLKMEMS